MELLLHMENSITNMLRKDHLQSHAGVPRVATSFLSLSFTTGVLVGVRCLLRVTLICVSLVTNDVKYLPMCLLVIGLSYLENCSSSSSFGNRVVIASLLTCESPLSIQGKFLMRHTIFSHSVGYLFTFVVGVVCSREF